MDKIRLEGGPHAGITLQGSLSGSQMYVSGYLYVWNAKKMNGKWKIFEYVPVLAFREKGIITKNEMLEHFGWEDDGGR